MESELRRRIISKLSWYGQEGCFVNKLFRELGCSKTDFVDEKNQLIKDGIINARKEGKQKIRLSLNSGYFTELDASFNRILQRNEKHANDALERLRKLKPLFKYTKDDSALSGVKATNQNVAVLLNTITSSLETISHYIMVFTLRYHIDLQTRKTDLKQNQNKGFETMQRIIEKLVAQHKDEEQELRNYLLWGTTSSFSYVF